MSPPALALAALLLAIVVSIVSRVNVGVVALALAWLVGVFGAAMKPDEVMAAFPASLFLTLTGVTLLFAVADGNGTLERITLRTVALARGEARWLPVSFFLLALLVASAGPGAILAVALLAPIGMPIAVRVGIPPFLMALAIGNGANAGNLSPLSTVGIIANAKMAEVGLGGHEGKVWLANLIAHLLVSLAAYLALGGHRLARVDTTSLDRPRPLERVHQGTALVIGLWIVAVLWLRVPLGPSAFLAATLLLFARAADESATIKRVPWAVILMVVGMSVLIGVLEKTGGMDLFTDLLARLASAGTVNGMIALVTGLVSTYSSTSGVVLPAFLPTAAALAERVGGADPLAVALSINVGSALVDVSPLSTLGALCVAAISDPAVGARLFRQLLIWGITMALVGGLLCQALAGTLARW